MSFATQWLLFKRENEELPTDTSSSIFAKQLFYFPCLILVNAPLVNMIDWLIFINESFIFVNLGKVIN